MTRAAAWRARWHEQLWPITAVLALPAIIAVALSDPGRYVGDNRFEQYWAPGWRIAREWMLWDGTRGMGRVGEEFWPVTIPMAFLRGIGLSPAASQHIWHATALTLAGLGVVCLVRVFQPRIGAAHLLAGLAFMCNPFSITFLVPSNLYWNYMLAPWLLLVALRGFRSTRPWSWAAAFALLVFSGGDTDLPGLVYSTLWLVPAAIVAVHVERWVTWRQVLSWLWRAALLTFLVSAATLMKAALGSGPLAQRLLYTETPRQVNRDSSWTESWRGLGYWLSYFKVPGRDPDVPGGLSWYESPGGVLLTFTIPVVALITLWRLQWRTRLLFMAVAVPGLLLMVGSYESTDPPPAGRLLLLAYRAVPSLSSMRNSYKAGSGLMLGLCVLLGVGASAFGTWLGRRSNPVLRPMAGVALAGVLLLTAMPFWNGGLYPDDKQMNAIPSYWNDTFAWLDRQPGDGRVLVLPGSTQTAYRWGWAGDDILDAFIRRHPNVVPTNFPVSGPATANVVDALERGLKEGTLTAEQLAPIAQRLGVSWVLVRNDLDWERIREPRPALLDGLRESDALPRVKTFGRPGQNTTQRDDSSGDARLERTLPPIEIYEVPGMADGQRLARPDTRPLFVDGDGSALPALAAHGELAGDRPVRFAGSTDNADLARSLDDGGSLVLTDTNRRRLTLIRGPGPTSSETLGPDQQLDQPPQDLFERRGTQSVASFPDAIAVSASGSGSDLTGFTPSLRAANAFDGQPSTAWKSGGLVDPTGSWIRARFREPTDVSSVELSPARDDDGGRVPTKASLIFSDGSIESVDLPTDQATVVAEFPARRTSSIEVRVDEVEGKGTGPVGFTEIRVPGLDLREHVAVPDHLFTAKDAVLQRALRRGDVGYLFQRSIGTASDDEELQLRRLFRTAGTRDWYLTARLADSKKPTDKVIDTLVGGPVGAWGTSRLTGADVGRGGLAVDGDLATSWAGAPRADEALTLRFPEQRVDQVRIVALRGPQDYPVKDVTVAVGAAAPVPVTLEASPGCDGADCPVSAALPVPVTTADSVTVRLAEGDGGVRPVRIAEVAVDGPDGPVPVARASKAPACTAEVLRVDDEPVKVRLTGDIDTALARNDLQLEGCGPLRLEGGEHRLTSLVGTRVDEVRMTSRREARPAPPATGVRAEVLSRSPVDLRLRVEADRSALVSTGQSYDGGWTATADGNDLGRPIEVEGQSAWRLPAGTHDVHLRYSPQRTFEWALAITIAGLLTCVVILARAGRRRHALGEATDDYGRRASDPLPEP